MGIEMRTRRHNEQVDSTEVSQNVNAGATLIAVPMAAPKRSSLSPSTLMRRLNEAAETV